jgi:hypothetical protein
VHTDASCALLNRWLSVENHALNLSDFERQDLELLRKQLIAEGAGWNEEELKMQFLAFIFRYARFNENEKLKIFYERSMVANINNCYVSVKCDCLIATPKGIYSPKNPYFFLQEFKKQKNNDDAEGQMLAAMLVAQQINDNEKPIYGCFLQGKNWTFTTLHQQNYCISRQYDATQPTELSHILGVLLHLKHIILTELID